jgi:hypothetical protein
LQIAAVGMSIVRMMFFGFGVFALAMIAALVTRLTV